MAEAPPVEAVCRLVRRGDGKVFVLDVLDALRLKSRERGEGALGPTNLGRFE